MSRAGVAAALVAVAALGAVLVGTWQASIPFISPSDLGPSHEGRRVEVEGRIIELRAIEGGVDFDLSDGRAAVRVTYPYGATRPVALEVGRVVVAKGVYRGGLLEAYQVSIRAHEADGQPVRASDGP